MCAEEVSESPPAWPEGERGVEVEASGPVGFSPQVVACQTSNSSTNTFTSTSGRGRRSDAASRRVTFALRTQTVHTETSDAGGAPQVEPEGGRAQNRTQKPFIVMIQQLVVRVSSFLFAGSVLQALTLSGRATPELNSTMFR